jgi:hypothetical protein
MRPTLTIACALGVSLATGLPAGTVERAAPDRARHSRLEADIRFLADDLLEGRATPGRGLDLAALFLANQLRAAEWEPGNGNSYFQTHSVASFAPAKARYRVSLNGSDLAQDEYLLLPGASARYDLVFCGFCVYLPEKGVDDFSGLDVRGKAVLAVLGAPWPLDPAVVHAPDRLIGKDVSAAVRGARLLVYVSEEFAPGAVPAASAEVAVLRHFARGPLAFLPELGGRPSWAAGPALILTPAAFDRTLARAAGGSYAELRQRLARGERLGGALRAGVEISVEASITEASARNVVAVRRGTDPARRDEWVVLSAHFDHVGRVDAPAGEDGVFNGADDNASGTAAVLEVARQLAKGPRTKRSVLVLLTAGEDAGLLGSAHYAASPLVPWPQVIASVNVDMVGRSSGSVIALTTGSPELFDRVAMIGREQGLDTLPDQTPLWRLIYFLDSYHFARFGVPVVSYFTALHEDYHQPSDEADKIRYPELARIAGAIQAVVTHYAGDAPRPRFERPAWFLTPPESPGAAGDAREGLADQEHDPRLARASAEGLSRTARGGVGRPAHHRGRIP